MGPRSHPLGDGDTVGLYHGEASPSTLQLATEFPTGDFARADAINHYKVTNVQEVSNPAFVVFIVK
jgi:hypothetical protein